MRLEFRNGDWKRIVPFYILYSALLLLMMWPFCLTTGECDTVFHWLWGPYLTSTSTLRFIFVVGFEFFVSLFVDCLVKMKPQQVEEEPDVDNQDFIQKVGLLIPCHKSASVIGATLELALHHFPPENIIVMDNGRSDTRMDDTYEEVRKISPDIIYRWVPVGHKAIALMIGSRLLPASVEYVMLIDDDVLIPKTMRFDSSYFDDPTVSAVAYPIAGCGADFTTESMNWVQRFQDLEFKLADTYRAYMSDHTTIIFAHGAVGLWRRERFLEIYSQHPGLPIGEDGWAGRLNLLSGYQMKQDSGPVFRTECPPDLVPKHWWYWTVRLWHFISCKKKQTTEDGEQAVVAGYGSPDLFNQRARRWDMNSPRRIWCHTKLFFIYGWEQYRKLPFHKALWYNLLFRLTIFRGFWAMFSNLVSIAYLTRMIVYGDKIFIVTLYVIIYWLQVAKYFLVNYWVWRHRPDLKVSWGTMCTMPLYRKVSVIYRMYGNFRAVLKYMPIIKTPDKVLGERDELHNTWPIVRDQTDDDFIKMRQQQPVDDDPVVKDVMAKDEEKATTSIEVSHGTIENKNIDNEESQNVDVPDENDLEVSELTPLHEEHLDVIRSNPYFADFHLRHVNKDQDMESTSLLGLDTDDSTVFESDDDDEEAQEVTTSQSRSLLGRDLLRRRPFASISRYDVV